eukprot:scaffold300794_cov30-Tisochrysis_lutea.AAC.3
MAWPRRVVGCPARTGPTASSSRKPRCSSLPPTAAHELLPRSWRMDILVRLSEEGSADASRTCTIASARGTTSSNNWGRPAAAASAAAERIPRSNAEASSARPVIWSADSRNRLCSG